MTEDAKSELLQKHWEMVREVIVHEDNLVNHRLTWLMSGHTFLFIAFGAVQNAVLTNRVHYLAAVVLEFVLVGVFAGAFVIARYVAYTIAAASSHHCHLGAWWDHTYPDEAQKAINIADLSPRDIGRLKYRTKLAKQRTKPSVPPVRGVFAGMPSPVTLPQVFMAIDLLIVVACLLLAAIVVCGTCGTSVPTPTST